MKILRTETVGICALRLVGSFGVADVETFDAHVEAAIDAEWMRVLIDAQEVRFVDSSALGALLRAQKRLQQHGGDLAICALPSFARATFKVLGLDRKLGCFDGESQAVSYLQGIGTGGVGVAGDQQVGFEFRDDAQIAVAGVEPRMGRMNRIGEFGVQFQWENLDHLDVDTMFATDAVLRLRFRLPHQPESRMFDAGASVVSATVTKADKVTVQTRFTSLPDATRRALRQFVRGGDGPATGGVGARLPPDHPSGSSSAAKEIPRGDD